MYDLEKKDRLLRNANKEVKIGRIQVDFLSDRDIEILTKVGLPDTAAPYFVFYESKDYAGRLLFDRIKDFDGEELEDEIFRQTCLIGFLDYGDVSYIAIDRKGIVYIYDLVNDYFTQANQSLDQFLDCTYAYSMFLHDIIQKYGSSAWVDCKYEEEDLEKLTNTILSIDEKAGRDTFWMNEIEVMRELKDE